MIPGTKNGLPAMACVSAMQKAIRIRRQLTPVTSVSTEVNFIPVSSNSFSSRWISRERSSVIAVRARVRSRIWM